jgi:predicted transposase/invertase (TIGR01784 family)
MGMLPADIDILPASDDRIFKVLLTAPNAAPVLTDLISAILQRPVTGAVVRNNEIPVSDADEKAERLDVNCRLGDGTQVDLEMQASYLEEMDDKHENLIGKSVYYVADLHATQEGRGKRRYDLMVQTYQVTFCAYTIFPDRKKYVHPFSLRHDEDNGLLTDKVRVVFIELSKLDDILKKTVTDMTDLEKWAVFLKYAHIPQHRETVNRIIESKEAFQVAGELIMNVSKDERERAVFRSRRMFQSDQASNMATAEDRGVLRGRREGRVEGRREGKVEGRREGKVEGRVEQQKEIAKKLLRRNRPIEEIIEDTGLSREEIEQLK